MSDETDRRQPRLIDLGPGVYFFGFGLALGVFGIIDGLITGKIVVTLMAAGSIIGCAFILFRAAQIVRSARRAHDR